MLNQREKQIATVISRITEMKVKLEFAKRASIDARMELTSTFATNEQKEIIRKAELAMEEIIAKASFYKMGEIADDVS